MTSSEEKLYFCLNFSFSFTRECIIYIQPPSFLISIGNMRIMVTALTAFPNILCFLKVCFIVRLQISAATVWRYFYEWVFQRWGRGYVKSNRYWYSVGISTYTLVPGYESQLFDHMMLDFWFQMFANTFIFQIVFITEYMSSGSLARFLQRTRKSGSSLSLKVS